MAARYPLSNASTPSGGFGAGLELVHTSCSPKRVPPVARKPRTYLHAPQDSPFTLRYRDREILVGRGGLDMPPGFSTGSRERFIMSRLGINTAAIEYYYNKPKILAAFWIAGEEDAEWKEIDFGSWDELSPFIHEICVVDKD